MINKYTLTFCSITFIYILLFHLLYIYIYIFIELPNKGNLKQKLYRRSPWLEGGRRRAAGGIRTAGAGGGLWGGGRVDRAGSGC